MFSCFPLFLLGLSVITIPGLLPHLGPFTARLVKGLFSPPTHSTHGLRRASLELFSAHLTIVSLIQQFVAFTFKCHLQTGTHSQGLGSRFPSKMELILFVILSPCCSLCSLPKYAGLSSMALNARACLSSFACLALYLMLFPSPHQLNFRVIPP